MSRNRHETILRILSGTDRSVGAHIVRAGLALAEPLYSTAVAMRNTAYNRHWLTIHKLPAPVISVGNLTTGGTGKTPMVKFLAESAARAGRNPAIPLRGYASRNGASDETDMLRNLLGPAIPIEADPDRRRAAERALKKSPVDLFMLDDAFQHRRIHRDLDICLISAANPWGFGHVLPRGLLRERPTGIRRADLVILTHTESATEPQIAELQSRISRLRFAGSVLQTRHEWTALLNEKGTTHPVADLSARPFFAFAAIGDPASLEKQLTQLGPSFKGHRWLDDHAAVTPQLLSQIQSQARAAGADCILTTEKDWAKISRLNRPAGGLPILRLQLELRFAPGDADRLLARIPPAIGPGP